MLKLLPILFIFLFSCSKDKIEINAPSNNNSSNTNSNTGNGGSNTTSGNNSLTNEKEAKLVWLTSLGGTGDEYMQFFTPTNDGQYLWGGYTNSDKSGNKEYDIAQTHNGFLNYNCYLVRSDDNGKIVKQNNYSAGLIYSATNTNNNFYFPNIPSILYAKTSNNILSIGSEDWVHSTSLVINNKDLNFFSNDYVKGVKVLPSKDQKVLLLADFSPGLVLFKVDQKLDSIVWRTPVLIKYHVGGSYRSYSDEPKLLLNSVGDIFIIGTERNSVSSLIQYIRIIKIGKDGNLIWEKSYDNNLYESLEGAVLADNGDIVLSKRYGSTNSEGSILKINPAQGDIIKELKIQNISAGNSGPCLVQKNGEIIVFHGNTQFGIYDNNLQLKGIVKLNKLDLYVSFREVYSNKVNELVIAGSSPGNEKYPSFGKSDFRVAKVSW